MCSRYDGSLISTDDEQLFKPWTLVHELLAGLREEVSVLNVSWGARKKPVEVPRPAWVTRGVGSGPPSGEQVRRQAVQRSQQGDVSAAVSMLKATAKGR